MSYATIQTAVAAVIKKHANYDANNVSEGDYTLLVSGKSRVVVLERGEGSSVDVISMGSPRTLEIHWVIDAHLYKPLRTRRTTLQTDITGDMQNIMDTLNAWPKLDSTSGVLDVLAFSPTAIETWLFGNSHWWRQIIRVVVTEIQQVTQSE